MSAKTIVTRTALCAAVAALGTAGLIASPSAHADSCTVNGEALMLNVYQSGATYQVSVSANGSKLGPGVKSIYAGEWADGTATGSIAGNAVDFIVDWPEASGGGGTHFRGHVGPDGIAHGTATGSAAKSSRGPGLAIVFRPGDWESTQPLNCAAPVGTGPAAGQKTATVVSDVDVYDKKNEPDGAGTLVGILRSPNKVQLLGPCQKKAWCNVSGDAVPGGSGWVWGALDF